ncbi:unnamed protein product [Symbiodinium sp. CCMP2456]|nr:unnamed protein product [Symbiodinium sp. CCMP2456]
MAGLPSPSLNLPSVVSTRPNIRCRSCKDWPGTTAHPPRAVNRPSPPACRRTMA